MRGELDWIVMKALDKDRNRRYETANGFAMDVRRYLADEPVQACPPSATYRLGKFLRRNKGPVLAAATLLSMLLITLALALYSKSRVDKALADRTSAFHQLEAEQKNTDEARRTAVQKAEEIRDGLEKLSVSNVLLERGRTCIDSPHKPSLLRSGAPTAADAFDRAVALRPDHSMALDARGHFFCRLGLFDEAAVDLERAYRLRSVADIKLDGASYDFWYRYACLRAWTGDLAGYREVCARMTEHLARSTDRGATDYWAAKTCGLAPGALADPGHAVRMAQAGVAWQPRHKYSLFALGLAYYRAGRFPEAVRRLKEADGIATPPWEAEALIWLGLALAHQRLGETPAARQWLVSVDRWLDSQMHAAVDPVHFALPVPWWQDWAALQLLYHEAAAAVRGAANADHAAFHLVQGRAYAAIGRAALSAAAFARADRLKPGDPAIAAAEEPVVLSDDPRQCRRDAEFLVQCVALAERDPSLSDAQRQKAAQGYSDQARALLEEARKRLAAARPRTHDARNSKTISGLAAEFQALANLSLALGDAASACEATRSALELMPDDLGAVHNYVAALVLAGDVEEHRRLCERTLERFGQKNSYGTSRVCTLAPDAVTDPAQLVAVAQKSVDAGATVMNLNKLGTAYYRAGQFELAIQWLDRSLKFDSKWEARVCNWLVQAMAHHRLGHADEARRLLDQAERWVEQASADAPRESLGPIRGMSHGGWMACRVLCREAQLVINGKPAQPPPPKAK